MNICSCTNKDCPLVSFCKRGLNIYQGEPVDFRYICNMDSRYQWIELIEENTITESENK